MNHYTYNVNVFYNNDAISYYLLGAFMSDGHIHIRKNRKNAKYVTLTSKDQDWLILINNLICPEKPLLKKGKNCYYLMYNSTKIADWLIANKCTSKKSTTLEFPNVPIEYLSDFIRGVWDGDGSLSFTKSGNKNKNYQRQANLTCASLSFCTELAKILNINNIKCNIRIHSAKGSKRIIENRILISTTNCYRIILSSGRAVYNLCKLMYNNNICMPRKFLVAQNIITEWEEPKLCCLCNTILDIDKHVNTNTRFCKNCK